MQVAQRVPFHSEQCPHCENYDLTVNRCRGFTVESWPKPILAVFDDATSTECSRYTELRPGPTAVEAVGTPIEIDTEASMGNTGQIMEEISPTPSPDAARVEGSVKGSPKPEMVVEKPTDIPPPTPERGQALVHCQKCNAQNSPTAERCQQCAAKLLPAESAGTRLTVFLTAIFAAGLFGYLIYRWFIQFPGSAPDIPFLDNFLNPIVLGLAAFIALITAITVPFRRTPEYVKYKIRAIRHIPLNPWQALDDLESAMELAPDKEQGILLKERAKLYAKVGFVEDAARDLLVLATSPERFKSEADAASLFLGTDSGIYANSRRSSEIANILKSGKAKAVGFCSKCNDVVVLNHEEHCPQHPKIKGKEVAYVIPADETAGKIAVMQKMEAGNHVIREKLTVLLSTGEVVGIGYCTECHAAVNLDSQRHCPLHNKAQIKHIQYALPREAAVTQKRIMKLLRGPKTGLKVNALVVVGIALLLIAFMLLVDIDLTKLFNR